MSETPGSSSAEALQHYQTGLDLKSKGQTDAALGAFRRAVMADPALFEAQLETAILSRDKARRDPIYKRAAFEAFRAAAHLRLDDTKAHDGYIVAAQESGKLEDLLFEYGELMKQHPANENLKRCYRNISALALAMVPGQGGDAPGGKMSAGMKKFLYIVASNLIFSGLFSIVTPLIAAKAGYMEKDFAAGVPLGVAFTVGGAVILAIARKQR